ncbi:MAG TPA: diguanylate cyclase, partial [Rhodocyclaceae bacterium]|nr:diguanylate cyclase [Rhodocyclaceae bacterium]
MDYQPLSAILTAEVVTAAPKASVSGVLRDMESRGISCIVVADSDRLPLGIFTERDAVLLLAEAADVDRATMDQVMSGPAFSLPASLDYRDAYQRMSEKGVRHLAVVDDEGLLTGVVSEADFLQHMGEEYLVEVKTVASAMDRHVLCQTEDTTLGAAAAAMGSRRTDYVVVTGAGKPTGLLTERDMVRLARTPANRHKPLGALMTVGVQSISPELPVQEAVRRMRASGVRRLLVMTSRGIEGIITRHDIVNALQGRYVEFLRESIARLRRQAPFQAGWHGFPRETLLGGVLDRIGDAVYLLEGSGRFIDANARGCQMLGYSRDQLQQLPVWQVAENLADEAAWQDWQTRVPEGVLVFETRFKAADGRWLPVEVRAYGVREGDDCVYVGIVRDLAADREAQERLRLAAQVFENSGEAIMITDGAGKIVSVNGAFTETTGYAADEVVGKTPSVLGSGYHDDTFYSRMWRSLTEAGIWYGEIWNRRKNGDAYPSWLGISTLRDNLGQASHYVAIFSDLSERKAAEARIDFLAHHDPLTNLPNRVLFKDRLEQAIAHAERTGSRAALLFADLDRFKTVNDSLGHPVGDLLLAEAARRLQSCVRDTDTVSRQGGDEFLLAMTDVQDTDAVRRVADKALAALAEPFHVQGHEVGISGSIGIAVFPDDGRDFDSLLKKADIARYHAKEAGRNVFRYYTERMNIDAMERLGLQNRLRRGLDRSEFILHYQPLIELASRRIVGAEALVRWQSPDFGLVPPGRFIPIAEESGLIVPIGEWVLQEACRELRRWHEAGHTHLSMAVNLSAIQFRRGNVEESVTNALRAAGADPTALELELTESILLHGAE